MVARRQGGCVYFIGFIILAGATLGVVDRTALNADTSSDLCRLKPEEGPCRALIPRWFNNFITGKCEEFSYGGCEGNANNFLNKQECEDRCKYVPKKACTLDPEGGPCRALIPRWHFNETDGRCKEFSYGGCGGNENNFSSRQACEDSCLRTKQLKVNNYTSINYTMDCEPQPFKRNCTYGSKRFFYNASKEACQPLEDGTCARGRNKYDQKSKCRMACFGHPGSNITGQKFNKNDYYKDETDKGKQALKKKKY
ncbi:kunitz-type U19-barytoxin-Tl1a-like [Ornithodoros turicata]|uniref:kunitz-type U19-barytoxin-Tl1a-like n=1 Tax=Ornithodoros turicata TaxID=34597 RepID=UPI0031387EEB